MRSSLMRIPSDHPSLSGHFPGNPIVPGVVILDRVIRFAEQRGYRIATVKSAKFKAPLLPETPFRVELSPYGDGLDFQVFVDDKAVVYGTLGCRHRATPEPR